MWKPGTLVSSYLQMGTENDKFNETTLYLVVSVQETGYGTLGPKWSATFLTNTGKIARMSDAWKMERYYTVVKEQADE